MRSDEIEATLTATEATLAAGGRPDVRAAGFWRAVAAVKRDPDLIDRHADRIAAIDRAAFEGTVPIRLPAPVGVVLHVLATTAGIGLMLFAAQAASPVREVVFLLGAGVVLGSTHLLAHWVVGRLVGIRFTHWYTRPPLPQPGIKIDYTSYLRAPARARAWMHASGAIVSKLVPFVAIPVALAAGVESWAVWLLVAVAVGSLITDATLSTRLSDWKRFRRELRLARERQAGRT